MRRVARGKRTKAAKLDIAGMENRYETNIGLSSRQTYHMLRKQTQIMFYLIFYCGIYQKVTGLKNYFIWNCMFEGSLIIFSVLRLF